MFRTILLNALTPIVVQVAVTGAVAMLLEAALSFLGLGTQPPTPSWGSMLNAGRSFLHQAPWYGLFPGIVITLSVLSLNALADTLQKLVDRGGAGRAVSAERTRLMARYVLFRLLQLLPVLSGRLGGGLADDLPHPRRSRDRAPRRGHEPRAAQPGADAHGARSPAPGAVRACGSAASCAATSASRTSTGCRSTTMLAQRMPVTLQLTVASLVVALAIAAPFGIVSAVRPHSWIARGVTGYNALAMAVPTFWLGILLVLCFGLWLRWLPPSGYVPFWQEPVRAVRFLILPAFTLGAYVSAVLARFTRAALLETLYQDYVRTARAKGLGERPVVGVHALRNALLPVVTVVGLQFGAFMGGAVITEAIFDYPGLGRMLLQAILTRDYTVVQGTILFVVVAFVIINLLTDLAYALLDPRIRYS